MNKVSALKKTWRWIINSEEKPTESIATVMLFIVTSTILLTIIQHFGYSILPDERILGIIQWILIPPMFISALKIVIFLIRLDEIAKKL